MTKQRVRHFSLFPQAKNIIKDARKFQNISQNQILKNLSKDITKHIGNKESNTCLTGTQHQADIFLNYDNFKQNDRVNPFTVEEYYFMRNNLPSIP